MDIAVHGVRTTINRARTTRCESMSTSTATATATPGITSIVPRRPLGSRPPGHVHSSGGGGLGVRHNPTQPETKQRRSGGRRSCLIGFEIEEEERDEMITCDGRSPVPECRGHKRRRQTKVSFDGEGMKKNDGA
jgi:hypothetical protein